MATQLVRMAIHSQRHNEPAGLQKALEYSRCAANHMLANWFGPFHMYRDRRFAEGVILGALREARYMALYHYKHMTANTQWAPRVKQNFVLLSRNHYSLFMQDGSLYLDAPLGTVDSGIEPLHVMLDSPPHHDSYCGEVLVTKDRIHIPYNQVL